MDVTSPTATATMADKLLNWVSGQTRLNINDKNKSFKDDMWQIIDYQRGWLASSCFSVVSSLCIRCVKAYSLLTLGKMTDTASHYPESSVFKGKKMTFAASGRPGRATDTASLI